MTEEELLDGIFVAYKQLHAGQLHWAKDTLRALLNGDDVRPVDQHEQIRAERLERDRRAALDELAAGQEADRQDLAAALMRLEATGENRISLDEVLRRFGYTREQLLDADPAGNHLDRSGGQE